MAMSICSVCVLFVSFSPPFSSGGQDPKFLLLEVRFYMRDFLFCIFGFPKIEIHFQVSAPASQAEALIKMEDSEPFFQVLSANLQKNTFGASFTKCPPHLFCTKSLQKCIFSLRRSWLPRDLRKKSLGRRSNTRSRIQIWRYFSTFLQ